MVGRVEHGGQEPVGPWSASRGRYSTDVAAPLLDARGLRKSFAAGRGDGRRTVRAVADVDIAIGEGETHGLVGDSGSGKSTTGRILLRLIEPDSGTVTFRGQDLLALRGVELRRMRRHIQLIYQDPFSSVDPRYRARDIVAEPWTVHGLYDQAERRRRADELLARVGIDPSQGDRRPASFSGGQLQRIGIARALALEPSLIVCDEPVSALDVSVQGQILNLLMDLKRELGIAYLFIAHDLAVVRHISDRVSVMYAGRIVETGSRDQLFDAAGHPYTRALLAATGMAARTGAAATAERATTAGPAIPGSAIPEPATDDALAGVDPTVGCAFRARCPVAQAVCSVERPELVDRGAGHHVACHFPVGATSGSAGSGEG
jgi:oligopeptide/dipeptide ABC transporter ATP-binding protein